MIPTIQADSFLTLHYRVGLHTATGVTDFLDTFLDKPATLLLGQGQLSPALESVLIGLPQGTHTTIELPAGAAYGDKNPDLVQIVAKTALLSAAVMGKDGEDTFTVGDVIEFAAPTAHQAAAAATGMTDGSRYSGTITAMTDTQVTLDFNHPLAGKAVQFEVHILSVL